MPKLARVTRSHEQRLGLSSQAQAWGIALRLRV